MKKLTFLFALLSCFICHAKGTSCAPCPIPTYAKALVDGKWIVINSRVEPPIITISDHPILWEGFTNIPRPNGYNKILLIIGSNDILFRVDDMSRTIEVPIEETIGEQFENKGTFTPPNNPETATAYFYYLNTKGLNLVKVEEASDWNGLLAHFKTKGCQEKYGMIWSNVDKGISINGKEMPVKGGVLTTNRGDILIGGEPIDFE